MAVPTELISAAIGALSGAAISVGTYRLSLSHQRNRDVREQLEQLVDLRLAQGELNLQKPANYLEASVLLNTKRMLHLAMANELAEKTHRSLAPNDLVQLGWENFLEREHATARRHYERAQRNSRRKGVPVSAKAAVLRTMGGYFFATGPDQDTVRGNRLFAEAVTVTASDPAPYPVYLTAITCDHWGRALLSVGDDKWREVAERARRLYEQLPEGDTYRGPSLAALEALLAQPTPSVQPPPLGDIVPGLPSARPETTVG